MRAPRFAHLFLLLLTSCRSGEAVPEDGAILLEVKNAPGTQVPDELRVWVYDQTGVLWDGARVPEQGSLAPKDDRDLGSILLQPGTFQGALRIHLRGMAAGTRVSDAILVVTTLSGSRTLDIALDAAEPSDVDGDGVPDALDDCANLPNPRQGGCPTQTSSPDAGMDAAFEDSLGSETAAPWVGETGSKLDLQLPANDQRDDGAADRWMHEDSAVPQLDSDEPDGTGDTVDDAPSPWADGLSADTLPSAAGDDAAPVAPDSAPAVLDGAAEPGDQPFETLPDASPWPPSLDASSDDARDGTTDAVTEADGGDAAEAAGDSGDAGLPNLPQGAPCSQNEECASGSCADGVCCTNACFGPCRSCNQPNANGVCQAYSVDTDPESECGGAKCNGAGACGVGPPPGRSNGELCTSPTQCLSGFCTDGVCCASACNDPCQTCGSGACQAIKRADDIPECTGGRTCNNKGKCVGT